MATIGGDRKEEVIGQQRRMGFCDIKTINSIGEEGSGIGQGNKDDSEGGKKRVTGEERVEGRERKRASGGESERERRPTVAMEDQPPFAHQRDG